MIAETAEAVCGPVLQDESSPLEGFFLVPCHPQGLLHTSEEPFGVFQLVSPRPMGVQLFLEVFVLGAWTCVHMHLACSLERQEGLRDGTQLKKVGAMVAGCRRNGLQAHD